MGLNESQIVTSTRGKNIREKVNLIKIWTNILHKVLGDTLLKTSSVQELELM